MNLVLLILEIVSGALVVLKQIPQTEAIATEIGNFEVALQDVITAATAAQKQAATDVDPTTLQSIQPQA